MLNSIQRFCNKIPYWFLVSITALFFCSLFVAFGGEDLLTKVKVMPTKWYDTVVAFCPNFTNWLTSNKVIVMFFVIIVLFMWIFKKLYRPCVILIRHSSMGQPLEDLNKEFEKSFYFSRFNIDQEIRDGESIIEAIKIQDNLFKKLMEGKVQKTVFYYGVAHTPLVFRFGYLFGEGQYIRLLHRFRPIDDSLEFKELPEYDNDRFTFWQKDENHQVDSQELLVAISTTYPIMESECRGINADGKMHTYMITVDEADRGYDFFNSHDKIKKMTRRIVDDIKKICKEYSIQKIHIVLSSSVPFTFFFGQHMHSNQFPNIVVYHYQNGKYPWGVFATESDVNNAVVFIEH